MRRRGSKKIDVWKWVSKDGANKAEVEVRMMFDGDQTLFQADYEPVSIREVDADINELKKRVEEKLETWYKMKWELWMTVHVTMGSELWDSGKEKSAVCLGVSYYAIGRRQDGSTCHMEVPEPRAPMFDNGTWKFDGKWDGVKWGGRNAKDGLPETKIRERNNFEQEATTITLIPATVENYEAVQRYLKAIRDLRAALHQWFDPKNVEETLRRGLKSGNAMPLLGTGEVEER